MAQALHISRFCSTKYQLITKPFISSVYIKEKMLYSPWCILEAWSTVCGLIRNSFSVITLPNIYPELSSLGSKWIPPPWLGLQFVPLTSKRLVIFPWGTCLEGSLDFQDSYPLRSWWLGRQIWEQIKSEKGEAAGSKIEVITLWRWTGGDSSSRWLGSLQSAAQADLAHHSSRMCVCVCVDGPSVIGFPVL